MKKFIISGFVLVLFVGYVLKQRFDGPEANADDANAVPTLQNTAPPTQNANSESSATAPAGTANVGTPSLNADSAFNTNAGTPSSSGTNSGSGNGSSGSGSSSMMHMGMNNGMYTGSVADALYGPLQVKAVIRNGKIVDVQFLQYPNDRGNSVEINTYAMPLLKQEAIQTQSANVDVISGATDSSYAFRQSLQTALAQAQ